MGIFWNVFRIVVAALTIVAVAELSKRFPRYGALLLSLPIISLMAFIMAWQQHHDLSAISKLAKETVVLVLLGLPFFLPLIFSSQLGLGFWASFVSGLMLAALTIGAWLLFAPSP